MAQYGYASSKDIRVSDYDALVKVMETGVVEDKLHLHWVLNEPTRTTDEHARLKHARKLAALLVGGADREAGGRGGAGRGLSR